jgi:hypothetical protein
MDAALQARLETGEAPFDGFVVSPIGEPAGEPQPIENVRSALSRVVPVLASEPRTGLQTFFDWWEHDGYVSTSEPVPWSALSEAIANGERLVECSSDDDWVSRAWYPRDFRFLLRWQVLPDRGGTSGDELVADWDVTCSRELAETIHAALPGLAMSPAREWFYGRV